MRQVRRVPRFPVGIPVTIESHARTSEGKITNLGLKGAFINLAAPAKFPTVVNLQFSPGPQTHNFDVLARVVRTERKGMATEFLDLDSHARSILWDSLLPLVPLKLAACLYCGQKVLPQASLCPNCHKSLQFIQKDYLATLEEDQDDEEMVGTCEAMRDIFQLIRKVASTDVPVLVTGASGTGKEMVARAIHERSHRGKMPFIAINCGAIPRELLESELFGHEKGAFTGAYQSTKGTVERAEGGTLFLDEVGELPLALQVKLLRFLQEFSFERVGGRKTIKVDLRVISATNADLKEMIAQNRFREDLYYRLDVVGVDLPPLKDRGDDVLIIANRFLKHYANKVGKDLRGFGHEAAIALQSYHWPGNIRELINRIRRSVVMAEGPWVTPEILGLATTIASAPEPLMAGLSLKEAKARFEADLLVKVLKHYQGNVVLAAQTLQISRSMMYHLIQKYDLKQYVFSTSLERNSQPHIHA
jgi:DNA-binding NtrC family response regulator